MKNITGKELIGVGVLGYLASASITYTIKELSKDLLVFTGMGEDLYAWVVNTMEWPILYLLLWRCARVITASRRSVTHIGIILLCVYFATQAFQFLYVLQIESIYAEDHVMRKLSYLKVAMEPVYLYLNMALMVITYVLVWWTLVRRK